MIHLASHPPRLGVGDFLRFEVALDELQLQGRAEPSDLDEFARCIVAMSTGPEERRDHGLVRLSGLRGAARAVAVAHLIRAHGDRPILVLVPNEKTCDTFVEDLRSALGEELEGSRVHAFPRHDTQPYERFSPQPFVVAQRMDVLYRWLACGSGEGGRKSPAPIVVATLTSLALRVPSRESVRSRSVHLEVGQTIDRDALVATLVAAGYARMPIVEERGELAVRGGILDLFPPQREHPIRVELLGDEVESIREFDAGTQRSLDTLGYAVAPPPRELLIDRSLVIDRSAKIRELAAQQKVSQRSVDGLLDDLLRGYAPPGVEALAPLLQRSLESVLDFLPADALIAVDDLRGARERLDRYVAEASENYEVALASGRVVAEPTQLLLAPEELEARLCEVRRFPTLCFEGLEVHDSDAAAGGVPHYSVRSTGHDELRRELIAARTSDTALAPLIEALSSWRANRWRVTLATPSLSGAERLRTLLSEYGIQARTVTDPRPVWRWSGTGRVEIRAASISEGFALPSERFAVVTEEEIFGPREKRRRRASWPAGAAIEAISQLQPGGYIVHADHGIGIYRGLTSLTLRGGEGEFLRLEYAEGDRLFLPVDRLNRIQVYAGSDSHVPRIDKLGGTTWEKAKGSVEKSLRNMAQELLSVHAARELSTGFSFSTRDRLFEEFEAAFPFEETPDQLIVIEDVLGDMHRDKPMDRLVCGDVGYGKTEVAVRAAFRAALDGRQTAILVPTTILCQQHEETFRARLDGYPIRLEALSRFQKPRKSQEILEGLASGAVDIAIGTHRLLHKNVRFRDLGLLVIDEEHRFGVAHKERIKQLKKTVDVLTLTATPIPRTLQLAFTGIRDLSIIETPPADRLAIRTQLCRSSESLVREVILREVRRGGQVFYVHNRVRSIGAVADMLARVVPEVKVIVAHGQMRERELEERMLSFMHEGADVLLCTTIIESGLDNPHANTMLIDRADKLGLAQLYQLRGRIGRSSRRAYAYLMIPGEAALTPDAERRLEAIQDMAELGSGFRLANMDLEIRGAGNLLGTEQHGSLAAVGYETYMEMLEATIDELRGVAREVEVDPEIRLPVAARLPEDYVAVVGQRLALYKRLASCRDDLEVDQLRDEILDRYGSLPPETANLLEVIRLKIQARVLGIAAVDMARGEFVLTASETTRVDPQRLMNLLTQAESGIRVSPGHKIYAPAPKGGSAELFAAAHRLLGKLRAR